jgi:MoxR-like ATPase
VQSALLEAMQERQVTIASKTDRLSELFMVMATQNPIEQEGTYPLPEAQVDRFMFKLLVDYPAPADERVMLDRMTNPVKPSVRPVVQRADSGSPPVGARSVHGRSSRLRADWSRRAPPGRTGLKACSRWSFGGARAGIYLIEAARARAFLHGRGYVIPDDVKELAPDVLRHRVITTYEAEAENITSDQIVKQILQRVEVP